MNLVEIGKRYWPIIKQSKVTVQSIEKIFLKIPWGIVFVVDEDRKMIGYYDVEHWNRGTNLERAIQDMPLWKNISEIDINQLGEYVLYPIVNENNCIIKVYYEPIEIKNIVSEQMTQLMEIQRMGYNFKHYLAKTMCIGNHVAIFTDYYRLKSSLYLGELFSKYASDIVFEGVFIYSG